MFTTPAAHTVVQVYRGGNFYPDKTFKTLWKKRASERIKELEAEGFSVKVINIPERR